MANEWLFCTSGAAISKAGENVSSTVVDYGANRTDMDKYSEEVQGTICMACRKDFVANHAGLDLQISGSLSDIASSLIANKFVAAKPSAYANLQEAQFIVNFNDNAASEALKLLMKTEYQEFS